MATDITVFDTPEQLATEVARAFVGRLGAAQVRGEVPQVALTGGTIAEAIHRELAHYRDDLDWDRVVFWWGDERFVAPDSSDRNARGAQQAFLDEVGATQVHPMPSTEEADNVDAGAAAYADEMREFGTGEFEIVMLGVGPDGHVASLFPGFAQLDADNAIALGVSSSPKPPPERITLSFECLARTRAVWFVASGDGKAAAVQAAQADGTDFHDIPAARPRGRVETQWFLDRAAASQLT